jgi:hypothetical protein
MKSLTHYLTESARTYSFKIKIAVDSLTDEQIDAIEQQLQAYKLVNISKPKRLPIQQNPLGFEHLGAVTVQAMEAELAYPATDVQVKEAVRLGCKCAGNHIYVGSEAQEQDTVRLDLDEKDGKPILMQDYDKSDPKVKELYGDENIKIILKDFDSKKRKYEFEVVNNTEAKSTNDLPQGKMSPVGSTQNKIPDPYKNR